MPSFVTPKKNTAFEFYVGLPSVASPDIFQANPTLAAGDAKVSIDGGALANLATLPSTDPAGGKLVVINLSAAEMNGDNIQVILSDAAGGEWKDVVVNIQTTANQIDDLALEASVASLAVDIATVISDIAALNNLSSADVEALLTATVADSIPADGTRPSIRSGILMLTRFLFERAVVGTTMTVSKEDGTTPSMTFTLNDADNPTSITRAT